MAGTTSVAGQAVSADLNGATAPAPTASNGQSANQDQTTSTGPAKTTANGADSGTDKSFFDPREIEHSPELKAAYKQMQAKWTKSMQSIKEQQNKISAYDGFSQNPHAAIQQLAKQYGYNLVQGQPSTGEDAAPKTWDDVYARAKQDVLKELEPALGEIRQLKQQNVEQYLDNKYSDWRTYEDEMLGLLKDHPSLAKDADKLYRLAIPEDVWEARATKAAMAKLKTAGDSGQISGARSTTNQTTGTPSIKSFNDAVAAAKAKLASEGIRQGV